MLYIILWFSVILQYSCLENSMDRVDWRATIHGAAKSWTWLSDLATSVMMWEELGWGAKEGTEGPRKGNDSPLHSRGRKISVEVGFLRAPSFSAPRVTDVISGIKTRHWRQERGTAKGVQRLHQQLHLSCSLLYIAQLVKNPPAMQEAPVRFLGWEDPMEDG